MLAIRLISALVISGLVVGCSPSAGTMTPPTGPVANPTPTPDVASTGTPQSTVTPTPKPDTTAVPTATATSTPDPIPADAPQMSVDDGVHIGALVVAITGEPGALVRYTMDGTEPSPTNGLVYAEPVAIPTGGKTVLRAVTYGPGWLTSDVTTRTLSVYARRVESTEAILLSRDDEMVIEDTYFVHGNDIELRGNARLVVRNARVLHQIAYNMEFGLGAYGESQVVLDNAEIESACTGSLNWNYFERSSLAANGVSFPACNTWSLFTDSAAATIDGWDLFGGTICNQGDVEIRNSREMEIELCYPANAVVDEDLSSEITAFEFPNENDSGIDGSLHIFDSSIDGWGITLAPGIDATFRNGSATVSVIVGYPWQGETVVLDGIDKTLYEDTTFEVVDAKLRLINVEIYGWEANVWGGNTLVVKNSRFSGATLNGGESVEIIEDSVLDLVRGHDRVEITVRNSRILGDVIATANSTITLIDSAVERTSEDSGGNVFAVGNGKVVLINTEVQGAQSTEDNGVIEVQPTGG